MKKIDLLAAGLAMAVLLAACTEKEGVYNPGKKIAKVYSSSSYVNGYYDEYADAWIYDTTAYDRYLAEEWKWDGKKLDQITFYEAQAAPDKSGGEVVRFVYDGKQVQRIEGEEEYMVFTYDGRKLQQVQLFQEGESSPWETYTFKHEGGKITQMVITFQGQTWVKRATACRRMEWVLLGRVLPLQQVEKAVWALRSRAAQGGAKGEDSITMNLTWTGDNVTQVDASWYEGGFAGGPVKFSAKFEFDSKNNPYQHNFISLIGLGEDAGSNAFFNKNNITQVTERYDRDFYGSESDVTTYEYTYDGDWPLTQTESIIRGGDGYSYSYTSIDTRYFEYVK